MRSLSAPARGARRKATDADVDPFKRQRGAWHDGTDTTKDGDPRGVQAAFSVEPVASTNDPYEAAARQELQDLSQLVQTWASRWSREGGGHTDTTDETSEDEDYFFDYCYP